MKTIVFLILCFLSPAFSYSQITEFAPAGAKWWYRIDQETPELYPVYILFEAESDTIIDGIAAVKISSSDFYTNGSKISTGFEYFKNDTSEISVYRNGSFHTFLKYNALEGDTVTVLDEPFNGFFDFAYETYYKFEYIIDSIGIEAIDGNNLIVYYIHESDDSDYWFGHFSPVKKIIKNIGAVFELSLLGYPSNIEFAGATPKGLYCYETNDFKLSLNGGSCDSLVTDISYLINNNSNFQITEGNTSIIIKYFSESNYCLRLYGISGNILYEDNSGKDVEINKSEFPTGLYILEIFDYSINEKYTRKYFIK